MTSKHPHIKGPDQTKPDHTQEKHSSRFFSAWKAGRRYFEWMIAKMKATVAATRLPAARLSMAGPGR